MSAWKHEAEEEDKQFIRISEKDSVSLRFPLGARVECYLSARVEWRAGTIVAHFYESPEFPDGRCAPYQIKLDERLPGPRGMRELVFVSRDVNSMIRHSRAR